MTLALLAWWAGAAAAGSLALLVLAWWLGREGEDMEEYDHWTCRACGTANYGDDCTRCGGPAPWGRGDDAETR